MRILLVSSFLPYPIFSGGHTRLFNIIKQLSKKHQIFLVCEKRDYQTKDDIKKVEEYCEKVITVDRKKQWSWQNIVKSGFSPYPFLMIGHTNSLMKNEIKTLLEKEKFDLIHVETFYVMQNLPKTNLPIVLAEHNIEHLVYKRYAKSASFFYRPLLYLDILKLKHREEVFWEKATRLVAVSEYEKSLMRKKDVVVVSNGVDLDKFRIRNQEGRIKKGEKRILFIGDFKWIENADSARWILKEIWPKIKSSLWREGEARPIESHKAKKDAIASLQHDVGLKLWIVGRKIPKSIKQSTDDPNVIFDEHAPDDTTLIYQKADILLAPIRVGGGTSFKILEAMASGVPVVTTSFGNEGIGAKEDKEVLIASNANYFAKKIIDILQDEKLYTKIAVNARKLMEEKYDWKNIVERLENVYESVV